MNEFLALNRFCNAIYAKNRAMTRLLEAEQPEFDVLSHLRDIAFDNLFVATANADGIEKFEFMLDIAADAAETLEFRRARVLNQMMMDPHYIKLFLAGKLNAFFGEGNWRVHVDSGAYTIYMDFETDESVLFSRAAAEFRLDVPANMIMELKRLKRHERIFPKIISVAFVVSRRIFTTVGI